MKPVYKNILKSLCILLIGFILGIIVNVPSCHKQESHIEYIAVHDTIFVPQERIVENTKTLYITKIDSFYIAGDTVYLHNIPIEYKEYRDTIKSDSISTDIKINYHGWDSNIDSIRLNYHYYREREIIIKQPKKIGIDLVVGPYVGYGINFPSQQINHGFEIGVGVMLGLGYRIK